jgi:carboxypeptidase PM20D1
VGGVPFAKTVAMRRTSRKKIWPKVALAFGLLLLILAAVLGWNTYRAESQQLAVAPLPAVAVSPQAAEHLAQALRFATVSPENPADFDPQPFLGLHQFLAQTYPLTDSLLRKEVVGKYSLLYHWPGRDSTLAPVLLMGHLDVVPPEKPRRQVELEVRLGHGAKALASNWQEPPFAGVIKNGEVWGRGAVDDKVTVIGIMEAVEQLLAQGYQPPRPVYLAFGHDEEIGGREGAVQIAQLLQHRGIRAEFVMDEGGIITRDKVPGMARPVALVGIAEKGYLSLELQVELPGGHSSMPGAETAIDVLARALVRLREQPFAAQVSPPVQAFMDHLGPEMPLGQRLAFANRWLFNPLIISAYEASPAGNATMRTTTAPTILESGFKDNVLPPEAKATVNFRILPGQTADEVEAHVRRAVADERVKLRRGRFVSEPSEVSSTQSYGYLAIAKTIRGLFPQTVVSPYLVVGGTDSRHYRQVSEHIYRFMPVVDPIGFHDVDERLKISDFENCVRFNYWLIKGL